MPDIDSLPPSYSPPHIHGNGSDNHHSPSPRASSSSLAAAATINAGIQHEDSRRSSIASNRGRPSPQIGHGERRRSNAFLSSHDPALPGPGELQTGDLRSPTTMSFPFRTASPHGLGSPILGPHHRDRAPSLGELHQELEAEQEAQVNRLLEMIRHQQAQLTAIQNQQNYMPSSSSAAVDDHTPPSERSSSYPYPAAANPVSAPLPITHPRTRSPTARPSLPLSGQSSRRSRTPSRTASPALRPVSAGLQAQGDGWFGERSSMLDDSAFYQAETQMLTRENQMLRARIRELERQLSDLNPAATNSPPISSNLAAPPVEAEANGSEAATGSHNGELEEKED
ncbi:hypothetical protein OEA41_007898 [Lepraria neglecta]|uniref:Uncharacterized protein n=1 Tax=Lepraria neglecta TaxID=209136 RepID=A0AAD9ZGI6_9LECA|nr:hypothetical protein OEA41_007898 [Lepraria neglecta]